MIKAAKKALDRRGFLRALPAVPLAAPSIAQEVARGGMSVAPVGGLAGYASPDQDWQAQRLAQLKRHVSGQFDDEDEFHMRPNVHLTTAYHYDSLRSLSPVMRAKFHAERVTTIERQNRSIFAGFELKRFTKGLFRKPS